MSVEFRLGAEVGVGTALEDVVESLNRPEPLETVDADVDRALDSALLTSCEGMLAVR
jgi:hypothetical protein